MADFPDDKRPNAPEAQTATRWRKRLLTVEFGSLAVLLATMLWLSGQAKGGEGFATAWLLIPTVASLGVFGSFLGLMYLRWVALTDPKHRQRQKLLFTLLAVTLAGVWAYGIGNTWLSLNPS
ncbi:hypothetical protein [Marinobacter sp. C2H3]|uniref:hypothetical protein n=1 Tax=Marinobacter sp. C2H3 TaxID=3119003 RepID=UPI00300EAC27